MAAELLVTNSYRNPRSAFTLNAHGTLNVLAAVAQALSLRGHTVITTDKVYQNVNQLRRRTEDDAIGCGDSFNSSKAMADILELSCIANLNCPPAATARKGNAIGGGVQRADLQLPDFIRACPTGEILVVHCHQLVRPRQHIVECLDGYITLAQPHHASHSVGASNFGSNAESCVRVSEMVKIAATMLDDGRVSTRNGEAHADEVTTAQVHQDCGLCVDAA